MNSRFQADNYTQELQDAGLRTPNSIKLVYDVNPGGGGPIVKDKLWFYSAARWQTTQTMSPACTRTRTRATRPSGPTNPT